MALRLAAESINAAMDADIRFQNEYERVNIFKWEKIDLNSTDNTYPFTKVIQKLSKAAWVIRDVTYYCEHKGLSRVPVYDHNGLTLDEVVKQK